MSFKVVRRLPIVLKYSDQKNDSKSSFDWHGIHHHKPFPVQSRFGQTEKTNKFQSDQCVNMISVASGLTKPLQNVSLFEIEEWQIAPATFKYVCLTTISGKLFSVVL